MNHENTNCSTGAAIGWNSPDKRPERAMGLIDGGLLKAQSNPMTDTATAARQSAKNYIRERAENLRRQADRLELLARSLPELMDARADQALFDLVAESRR